MEGVVVSLAPVTLIVNKTIWALGVGDIPVEKGEVYFVYK